MMLVSYVGVLLRHQGKDLGPMPSLWPGVVRQCGGCLLLVGGRRHILFWCHVSSFFFLCVFFLSFHSAGERDERQRSPTGRAKNLFATNSARAI